MRLPWLQIDADGMTRGEMLGRLLGIGPDAGIGITMRLWRWALELSPDGDFTGGTFEPRVVAAAIGWDHDVERLVLELSVVGLIERIPGTPRVPVSAGLVRIRGLDRYKRAWEKNQKRRPAQKAPVTGTSRAGLEPEPARKTETETETENLEAKETSSFLAQQVFDHWVAVAKKNTNTTFTDTRKRKVGARLGEGYTPAQLKDAIDGCAVTPHNQGETDGQIHDDLELICRSAGQVDRFIRNKADPPRWKKPRPTSADPNQDFPTGILNASPL
jgi:hypothetical protein